MADSRYIIGIDLGTTNSVLSYIDTVLPEENRKVEILQIPQVVAQGEVDSLPMLPSFVYLPQPNEIIADMFMLPWESEPKDIVVGAYARDIASRNPSKVVASAKSWLCYDGIDRHGNVLPWSQEGVPRQISPVQASRIFLEHLRDAWNYQMADGEEHELQNQTVLLTVPASFDAVARELTVEAAAQAGLHVRLLEEPQAAFYAWLETHGDEWRNQVQGGDIVLVCDIGGGTTDFSLIAVIDEDGVLGLQRIAVGDHTLLGGDNMDLALAYSTATKLQQEQGVKLDSVQLVALTHACREAKERIGAGDTEPQQLTILGRGAGVIGGSITTHLSFETVNEQLVEGFFPECDIGDAPQERRRTGLRTFGLDYAVDPAFTRHLAGFLGKHSFRASDGRPLLPSAVLFNGGVTKANVFRDKIIEVLQSWTEDDQQQVNVLARHDPDLAVAVGAAWYGYIQRIGGLRIKAGSPRSYYIGIESTLPAIPGFAPPVEALCVVAFGMEEGTSAAIEAEGLGLVVGEPTEFRFFSSTTRNNDEVGSRLTDWSEEELHELPPLSAELPVEESAAAPIGTLVPISLEAELTEIGTLQIWCNDIRGEGRWKLEFELRAVDDGMSHEF